MGTAWGYDLCRKGLWNRKYNHQTICRFLRGEGSPEYGGAGERDNGSGSLMSILPVGLFHSFRRSDEPEAQKLKTIYQASKQRCGDDGNGLV